MPTTFQPHVWADIAQTKGMSLINVDKLDRSKIRAKTKLELQCITCHKIVYPTISEIMKPRYHAKRCRCHTNRNRDNARGQDTEDWKVIQTINHPFASEYNLSEIKSYYMVSRRGEIKNVNKNGLLDQPSISNEKYARVNLRMRSNKYGHFQIHTLVALGFVPIRPEIPQDMWNDLTVDHLDRNTLNNCAENLRWATREEQSINRSPQKSGTIWILGTTPYFSQEDFKQWCPSQDEAKSYNYDNWHDRLRFESSIELSDEIWKPVMDKGKQIFISSYGRCYYNSYCKKTWGGLTDHGYMRYKNSYVHCLVAKAFLNDQLQAEIKRSGVPEDSLVVNHKNGRKCDNRLSNLEWVTQSQNAIHSHGLIRETYQPPIPVSNLSSIVVSDSRPISNPPPNSASNSFPISVATPSVRHMGRSKPVYQVDKTGQIVRRYPSLHEAKNSSGFSLFRIRKCLAHNAANSDRFYYGDYTWLECEQNSEADNEEVDNKETLIDLEEYCSGKKITIPTEEFDELKTDPRIIPSIMAVLERFSEPLLPEADDISKHWHRLFDNRFDIERDDEDQLVVKSKIMGTKILNHFMYNVMIQGHPKGKPTYFQCWTDRRLREKLVRRMLDKDTRMNNGSLYGCYGCQYGRLYNFPPNVARTLFDHFKAKRVLDFCAGFGGRLLGFWASDAEEYVGIDPNTKVPYQELITFLNTLRPRTARVISACAEDVDYTELGEFDTILTSPPYFNTEIYSEDKTQSIIRYPKFENWLSKFLLTTLSKAVNVLKSGGTLMINIKDPKGYKIIDPMLAHLRGLNLTELEHIKLHQSKRYPNNKNYEYIYVFTKP